MKTVYTLRGINGFQKWYDYAYKKNKRMITKTAKDRHKILEFWWKFGKEAVLAAYGTKRSTLYSWQKVLRQEWLEGLNPGSQARKTQNQRVVDPKIIAEIKHLRLEVCPNMGKDKVKIFVDRLCEVDNLTKPSASTIGRIIKDKKIYHHRQKVSHFGKIKIAKRKNKLRKPNDLVVNYPGELVEIDTVVRFIGNLKRYIVTVVDTFGRPAFAWCYNRATSANTRDFFQKMQMALPFASISVQTDNGSEFHKYFMAYLEEQKITHYWNYPGRPYRNGHIEKFNRTIQEEFIDQNEMWLDNPIEFNKKLMDWLLWYNTERPHWSLRLQSPVDYLITNGYLSNMTWTDTIDSIILSSCVK